MNTTHHTKSIVTAIVAGALAIAAPAGASVLEPVTNGWNPDGNDATTVTAISHSTGGNAPSSALAATQVDPASVAGFEPTSAAARTVSRDSSDVVTLRRDGSQATAFVADVGSENPAAGDGNGFDWGDAAIGAGAGLLAVALLMLGTSAIGRRSDGAPKPGSAVSQGA